MNGNCFYTDTTGGNPATRSGFEVTITNVTQIRGVTVTPGTGAAQLAIGLTIQADQFYDILGDAWLPGDGTLNFACTGYKNVAGAYPAAYQFSFNICIQLEIYGEAQVLGGAI